MGKLLQYVTDKNIFEEKLISELKLFIELYNISKHEILSNDKLDRTFHADDARIFIANIKIMMNFIEKNVEL